MKFWVRDKVAVYMGIDRFVGHVVRVQERILHVQPVDRPHEVQVAPQQCRRLIKKKRREVWVSEEFLKEWKTLADCPHIKPDGDFSFIGYVKFREVKD